MQTSGLSLNYISVGSQMFPIHSHITQAYHLFILRALLSLNDLTSEKNHFNYLMPVRQAETTVLHADADWALAKALSCAAALDVPLPHTTKVCIS